MYLLHFLQIHFPTGTYVEVKNHRITDPKSLNTIDTLDLHVNPSIADNHLSQGLCGEVGSGSLFSPKREDFTNNIPKFTNSWRYV